MANDSWNLTGNSQTSPAMNFIGTTDQEPLLLKTNGVEAVRITAEEVQQVKVNGFLKPSGRVGIGTDEPHGKLHVSSAGNSEVPQVEITQVTPFDFARLRFFTFGHELVAGGRDSFLGYRRE